MACKGTQQNTILTTDLRFWSPVPTHLQTYAHTGLFPPLPRDPPTPAALCLPPVRRAGRAGHGPSTGLRCCPRSRTGTQALPTGPGRAGCGQRLPARQWPGSDSHPGTDLADGTGSVGAGWASTYQGVPAGSLCCASQEPSCGDKFQPGLT